MNFTSTSSPTASTSAPQVPSGPELMAHHTKKTWRGWMILWVIVGIAEVLLLANNAAVDTYLWRSVRWFYGDQDTYRWAKYHAAHAGDAGPLPFYMTRPPPLTRTLADGTVQARMYMVTEPYWQILKSFGDTFMIVIVIAAVIFSDRRRWKAGAIMVAGTAAAGGLGALIRIIGGRFRPVVADGANHW